MKKALLDEGVPKALAGRLLEHRIIASAFPNEWKGMKNGALLSRAETDGFDVLVTSDKNLYAHRISGIGRSPLSYCHPADWRT